MALNTNTYSFKIKKPRKAAPVLDFSTFRRDTEIYLLGYRDIPIGVEKIDDEG